MFIPKRVKYRKSQRGRRKGLAVSGSTVSFGEFAIKALEPAWVKNNQLETCRVILTRRLRRGGKLWIRIFPDKPITKKPAETRMGKGKGDVASWVASIKRGAWIAVNVVILPMGDKPYSKYYSKEISELFHINGNLDIIIDTNLGPVPISLDEMYPFAQSVFPDLIDNNTKKNIVKIFKKILSGKNLIYWNDGEALSIIKKSDSKNIEKLDFDRISAVADFQFGKNASKALFNGNIEINKSKKTGKIRNIICNGKHILSMRANDGMFTLKIDGARSLHSFFKYPKLRVIVHDDAVPFIKDGKSVFARFIIDCDEDLRPFDECLIVSRNDELLAVGRCLLNRFEMNYFDFGMAAKTREHV